MTVALVNSPWAFENSVSFGCRAPHCPLELGYAKELLEVAGHEPRMLDGHPCRNAAGIIQGGRPLASNALEAACWHG